MHNSLWVIPLSFAWACVELLLYPAIVRRTAKRAVRQLTLAALHAATAYLFCLQPQMWMLPSAVFILSAVIYFLPTLTWRQLLMRYLVHVAALIVVVWALPFPSFAAYPLRAYSWLIWAAGGVIVIVFGAGQVVGLAMAKLAAENDISWQGLSGGGLWIGRLERLLIYLFMAAELPAGIGFLVAAKSVLRFSETRDNQKLTEYVLIGTLASYSLAVAGSMMVLRGITLLKGLFG